MKLQKYLFLGDNDKPVVQSHRSYEMEITAKPNPADIRLKVKNDKDEVLKKYEIVHEKIMH